MPTPVDDIYQLPIANSETADRDSSRTFVAIVVIAMVMAIFLAIFLSLPNGYIGALFVRQEQPIPYPTNRPAQITLPTAKSIQRR
jgi:hypothetical protein